MQMCTASLFWVIFSSRTRCTGPYILEHAGAAFSEALKVGHSVMKMKADRLYKIRDRVSSILGAHIEDSRLLTHYAFYIACVKKVINPNSNLHACTIFP